MDIFLFIVNGLFLLIELFKNYFWESMVFVSIIIVFKFKKDYSKADSFIKYKTGMIVLDGLFNAGKTRFMTMLAKECKELNIFVLGNFYNGYNFIKWNSLQDLQRLLEDLLILGEYQNFSDEDIKTIYGNSKEEYKEKIDKRKYLKKTYKNIPYNGFFCNFLILGDEFQNYFYNREAMGNFSGDKKGFLKVLHQVRHFNSLCIFGTQNASELDVKFRKLSSLYVNTFEKLNGLFFGYNVYSFSVDRDFNLDIDKAIKYNKVPIFKLNLYTLNKIIGNYLLFVNRLTKIQNRINEIIRFELFSIRIINFRFKALQFYTKYNVNPDINTYKREDLFIKLNEFFKDEKLSYKYNNLN